MKEKSKETVKAAGRHAATNRGKSDASGCRIMRVIGRCSTGEEQVTRKGLGRETNTDKGNVKGFCTGDDGQWEEHHPSLQVC